MRMSSKSPIRTAVFPVAGRGTRFLPATKASPKEMLPVVDKPLIQYAVEEALQAGARRLVFVTGASKRAIEDHFDSDQELETMLQQQGKSDLLNQLRSVLPSYASCIYIRQPAPLGLGHAVLCAQPAVGAEPLQPARRVGDEIPRRRPAAQAAQQFRDVMADPRIRAGQGRLVDQHAHRNSFPQPASATRSSHRAASGRRCVGAPPSE